ncbi:MAG: pirin family protein [Actinomycetota bacterium]|nr:pirin family protein [Actinomycetota bacterium]
MTDSTATSTATAGTSSSTSATATAGTSATVTTTRPARVVRLIRAQHAVEGDGFVVRRPFPTASLSHIDPFLLFDHMGPVDFEPGRGVGTPWHPHRGFETVTYLLEGDAEHRDSMGNQGFMSSGDTQWMTAGSGVLHKEGPTEAVQLEGGRTHGLQLWVNLPAAKKMIAPAYQDLRAAANARRDEPGATVRVIAGELFGLTGPGSTHTPISYAHVTLAEGASVSTPLPAGHVVLAYPMTGAFTVGTDGGGGDTSNNVTQVDEGILSVIEGDVLTLTGAAASSEVIVLTGAPIGEPVARYGPFVMNTEAEIRQAFSDFERGDFGAPTD